MKYCLIIFLMAFSIFYIEAQNTDEVWSKEREKQHLLNRQDSSTWDYEMLHQDMLPDGSDPFKPLRFGSFPVPKYSLLGEEVFKGIGVGSNFRKFGNSGNHLIYPFLLVRRNKLIEKYIPEGKENEVFFTIIVLSDIEIDTVNYTHARSHMTSRNNPDYLGEGFIKTKNDEIGYLAFLTADRDEYAVVNMRLFNLKNGRVVLIAPQKDGSLRSMQLKPENVLSLDDLETYIDEVLEQKSVQDFFTYKGNI